jgi:uncharacterized protein YodC (DUF2158 family)
MDEIKKGEIVRLKSGGPTMTVESTDGNFADCIWFDQSPTGWTFKRQSIDVTALMKATAGK